jgi:hypothetical protein
MLPSLEKPFVKHVNQWAADFYNTAIVEEFSFFAPLMGIDDTKKINRKVESYLTKCLDRQIVFVEYFATCKLLESDTKANLESTKKFVSIQNYSRNLVKTLPPFEVFFYLSNNRKVFLYANDLGDIDFADIFSAIFFEGISISNRNWKHLTENILNSTLKAIHEDMAFDHYEIQFDVPEEFAPNNKNTFIFTQCLVEGMPSLDKIVKMNKAKELFNIDVFKWFKP